MSKWEQIKEIKGLLAAIVSTAGICIIIGGALMEWRVNVNVTKAVAAELAKQDLATDIKIIDMDKATASNTSGVADNKEDITLTQTQLRDVARVLMQSPLGE